jgi:hypothetical protein
MKKMISSTLVLTLAIASSSLSAAQSYRTERYCATNMDRQQLVDYVANNHGLTPDQADKAVVPDSRGADRHKYCLEVDHPTGTGVRDLQSKHQSKDVAKHYRQRVRLSDGTFVSSTGLTEQQLSQDHFKVDSDTSASPGSY